MKRLLPLLGLILLGLVAVPFKAPVYGAAGGLRWVATDDADQVGLFDGDKQLGIYLVPERAFYPLKADKTFGTPTALPAAAPTPIPGEQDCKVDKCTCGASCKGEGCECGCQKGVALPPGSSVTTENYGVDVDKIRPDRIEFNGRDIAREEALELIEKGLPEDRDRLRLTVISADPKARELVVNDLATSPSLVPFKDKVLVQSYDPMEWPLAPGFICKGNVTIYLQSPPDAEDRGKVLHRQDDYLDGAEGLAVALRKADPQYDASKDPDLRKQPVIPGADWLKKNWAIVAIIGVGVYLFSKGKKEDGK
jgi:hypothetical protein